MPYLKRAVIIANGVLEDFDFYRDLVSTEDLIICVNGGSTHAVHLGLQPDLVIGDLDSLSKDGREKVELLASRLIEYPSEKDKSDLELALDHTVAMRPAEIVILGALGGKRTDHAFINLLLLNIPLQEGIKARIIDHSQEICLIDKEMLVEGNPGDYLSLFSLVSISRGIYTDGLKYRLQGENLLFASTLGLSNEFNSSEARVKVDSGLLMMVKTRRESL